MKEIFYGAAIQGGQDRQERAYIHRIAIETIKAAGYKLVSEHTQGKNKEETAALFKTSVGVVPKGIERSVYIRHRLLQLIDSHIIAAIFEASTPSLGTGIEIDRVCTRKARGLLSIPLLILYQQEYWSSGLSTMVRGITSEEVPGFTLAEYTDTTAMIKHIKLFLSKMT